MPRRIIEISGFDAHLSAKLGQVRVGRGDEIAGQFPADEVGLLISDTRASTFSNSVLIEITQNNGLVILCGPDHLPAAMVIPIDGHHLQKQRLHEQLQITTTTRKQLWKEVVSAKIRNQAFACDDKKTTSRLMGFAGRVKSGDTNNMEATAARLYWQTFLPQVKFRRDRNGPSPNDLLNYGYMVFRAAVARSLFAAGLNPIIGISHCNRSNPFCLADDLIEPFRPWIDITARQLYMERQRELTPKAKAILLRTLFDQCAVRDFRVTIQAAIDRLCYGFLKRIQGGKDPLPLPRFIATGEDIPEANESDESTFRV